MSKVVCVTVVIMSLVRLPMPYDACQSHIQRWSDAHGATVTSPGCGGPSTARPGPTGAAATESQGRSAGYQTVANLARRQWALLPMLTGQQLFLNASTTGSRLQDGQQG
jgi:hypothetical protein